MENSMFKQLSGKPDGCYVTFKRIVQQDEHDNTPPDQRYDGYWPSLNPKDDGFIGHDKTGGDLVRMTEEAQKRYDDFMSGALYWQGVKARAVIHHKSNRTITTYTMESAGVWGVESDCDEAHLQELFESECGELQGLIAAMRDAVYI